MYRTGNLYQVSQTNKCKHPFLSFSRKFHPSKIIPYAVVYKRMVLTSYKVNDPHVSHAHDVHGIDAHTHVCAHCRELTYVIMI